MALDPFGNKVVLYEKTWEKHTAPKHNPTYNEQLPDLGDVRESVLNPDQIRRSLHPVIGNDSCIFEKFIGPENQLLRTFAIFDLQPGVSYEDDGQNNGHIMTTFYPDPPYLSRNVGEVFWVKPKDKEEK